MTVCFLKTKIVKTEFCLMALFPEQVKGILGSTSSVQSLKLDWLALQLHGKSVAFKGRFFKCNNSKLHVTK